MDYKQSVMSGVEDVFQSMASGATQAPLSRNIVITSSEIYAQKRSKYLQRLTTEKNTFNSAIKEIQKKKAKRIEEEAQRRQKRKERKEQFSDSIRLPLYWCFVALAIAIIIFFSKNFMEDLINWMVNESNGLDNSDYNFFTFVADKWADLWPSWVSISVALLATAIIGRIVIKTSTIPCVAMAIEGAALLIYAFIVLCINTHEIADIIGIGLALLIYIGLYYIVPVSISAAISMKICGVSLNQ